MEVYFMHYRVQLLRGIVQPYIHSHQLKKAEHVHSVVLRSVLLLLAGVVVFGLGAYFGIGNETISKRIYEWSPAEFEARKVWFAVGQIIWGMTCTSFMIFFPALLFWILTDLEYKKLVVLQLFVTAILLLEKGIQIPLQLILGIEAHSSPFSLGVIGQYITNQVFIVSLLGGVTLFKVWTIFLQYYYLKIVSTKTSKQLLIYILAINLFFWIFASLLSTIQFDKMF